MKRLELKAHETREDKDMIRREIEADTAKYLATGGNISVIKHGACKEHESIIARHKRIAREKANKLHRMKTV